MAAEKLADLFAIESDALPGGVRVAGFKGIEAISQLFRFEIGVLTSGEQEIDLAKARGCKVTLKIKALDGDPMLLHGMISRIGLRHCWQGQALYQLEMVPQIWAMTLTQGSRVFVDKTVKEIVEQMFKDAGIPSTYYEINLANDYPKRFHVGQYMESGWSFVARLLERDGILFFFDHSGTEEKLVIGDKASVHEVSRKKAVRYIPLSGTDDAMSTEAFRSFTCDHAMMPAEVRSRDYDYLKPALAVFGDAEVGDSSTAKRRHLGDGALDEGQASAMAQVRADEWLAREVVYRGSGRAFPIRSGYRFSVEEHPLASMNHEFVALEVRHHGQQGATSKVVRELLGLDRDDDYHFEVRAIQSDRRFVPPRTTPVPRIYSLERGFVDGPADSDYAQIDEHGRYKVKMHFDIEDKDTRDGTSSTWLRMIQPHGGAPEGFHLPLRKDTEVLIAHLGGDPDRPVIVGAVPSAVHPSPVTSDNHTQNVIQTGGENRFEMEDLQGKQYIDISTPPKDTRIHLGEPHGAHSHYIVFNTQGNQFVNIGANKDIEIGGPQKEHVHGALTETYDTSQTTKVTGPLDETVTSTVKETYGSTHTTTVASFRSATIGANEDRHVTGWWNLKADAGSTIVSPHIHGTGGTDIIFKTPAGQLNFSSTADLFFGTTKMVFGATTVDIASLGGKIGSITLNVPGGSTITTPNWQVNDGKHGATFGWKWEAGGLALSATGATIQAVGAAVQVARLTAAAAGTALAAAAVNLSAFGFSGGVQGNQTDTAALRTELVAAKVIT